jgi:hypothetical protein
VAYTRCASSAESASSARTRYTRTCASSTRSASSASASKSVTSSLSPPPALPHDVALTTRTSFQNYPALEKHFGDAHFPCQNPECLAKKFVVFGSAMDLQAHMVQEHGGGMSSRDRRDAMRIQADFAFEEVPGAGRPRRGGAAGGGGGGRDAPQPGPSRGGRRREFGGHLTAEGPPAAAAPPPRAPSPPHGPLSDDPEVIQ